MRWALLTCALTAAAYVTVAAPASASAAAAAAVAGAAAASSRQPIVQLMGRFSPGSTGQYAGLPQWMTWPASSATVTFEGSSSVAVVLDASKAAFPDSDEWVFESKSSVPEAVFQFDLDGKPAGTAKITKASPVLTWRKTGLSTGKHTLRISKLSEARYGAALLKSIRLSAAGRFVDPPATPGHLSGRRMLFLGDSVTAGSGSIGDRSCAQLDASTQDGLLAYGPTAARALRADYQVLGFSGATVVVPRIRSGKDWTEAVQRLYQPRMQDLLPKADALGPSPPYNLSAFVPEVVVMAAGVNDFIEATFDSSFQVTSSAEARLPPQQEWVAEYVALIRQIHETYPAASIISMAWPLEISLTLLGDWEKAQLYSSWMAAATSHVEAARIPNHHFLQLESLAPGTASPSKYCKNHPNAAAHAQIAAQLSKFVQAVVPSFASS